MRSKISVLDKLSKPGYTPIVSHDPKWPASALDQRGKPEPTANERKRTMPEKQPESKHEVRIHIYQHQYESPNPTTGDALYALGRVPHGLVLYREVSGDREDLAIKNGPEVVHLKED